MSSTGNIAAFVGPIFTGITVSLGMLVANRKESRDRREGDKRRRLELLGHELRTHLATVLALLGHPSGLEQEELFSGYCRALQQLQIVGDKTVVTEAAKLVDDIRRINETGTFVVAPDRLLTALRNNIRQLMGLDPIEGEIRNIEYYAAPDENGVRHRIEPKRATYDYGGGTSTSTSA
jgi:hypothetical protein